MLGSKPCRATLHHTFHDASFWMQDLILHPDATFYLASMQDLILHPDVWLYFCFTNIELNLHYY